MAGSDRALITDYDIGNVLPSDGEWPVYDSSLGRWKFADATSIDHGSLSGTGDDDHLQYIFNSPAGSARNVIDPNGDDVTALVVRAAANSSGAVTFRVAEFQTAVSASILTIWDDRGTYQIQCDQHLYANEGVIAAGTSFPSSPIDGMRFIRTDLDPPNDFVYDSGRSTWRTEPQWLFVARNGTLGSDVQLQGAGGLDYRLAQGPVMGFDWVVTGYDISTNGTTTCEFFIRRDATTMETVSFSSSDRESDYSVDLQGSSGERPNVRFNHTGTDTTAPSAMLLIARRAS